MYMGKLIFPWTIPLKCGCQSEGAVIWRAALVQNSRGDGRDEHCHGGLV
ncbi:hypothetical protein GCK32_022603 [Trichostrongylus colubriformis]|uniref:Uncharacterized protein n=1 Tax=Trichostrongylus colubriformis TaxID=6319 RepID=A0AAN8J2I8_TRICO